MLSDYYKILDLEPGADEKSIKKAFRKLALKYHPDVNSDPDAKNIFQKICEAYEVLISKEIAETRVYASPVEDQDLTSYEEILREAREKAAARARMKYEKLKAEKEFFENNDFIVILRYIVNYIAVPLSFGLVIFPVVIAITEGIQMFFGLFFFWIIGSVLIAHIYSKRKTWFHPGKVDTRWKDVINFFRTSIQDNPRSRCYYSDKRMGNSTPFKLFLFKVREVDLSNSGPFMHNVGYRRKYKEVIIPRSAKAYRVHFLLSFLKPGFVLAGMLFFPIPSWTWRFIAAFIFAFAISRIILLIGNTLPKTSFLLTPFMIIKLALWILVICSQTTYYNTLVFYTSEYLTFYFIIMFIFLDMVLDLLLRILPFYQKLHLPIFRQPPTVRQLFRLGYQNYLDVPVWSTIYPFFRWLI